MKLWLLRPKGYENDQEPEPWKPWYDKAFGFVLRAQNISQARRMASMNCGDEGEQAWLNARWSTCEELTSDGEPGFIMFDIHSA